MSFKTLALPKAFFFFLKKKILEWLDGKKNKPIDFSSEVVLITLYHLLRSSTSCIFASYLRWMGFSKFLNVLKE